MNTKKLKLVFFMLVIKSSANIILIHYQYYTYEGQQIALLYTSLQFPHQEGNTARKTLNSNGIVLSKNFHD